MKTYIVKASETVLHEVEVQAKTPEEAQELGMDLITANLSEPIGDSNGLQIDSVEEKE